VLVDFTAAWCISCQVNKRTSLRSAAVEQRLQALGVATLEADWTNADPAITAALARLHRNAVPVYAIYPRGGGEPRLLPEVLTPGLVLEALDQAAHS
jgi:thiol:disulfide interchange protein DsbD